MNIRLLSAIALMWLLASHAALAQQFVSFHNEANSTSNTFNDLVQLSNGNYVCVGGSSYFPVAHSTTAVVYDVNGQQVKQWKITPSYAYTAKAVTATNDGGFMLTGLIELSPTEQAIYIMRFDALGDSIWTKTFVPSYAPTYSMGNDILATADGGFVITGDADAGTSYREVPIVKFDGNGDTVWTTFFNDDSAVNGFGYDYGYGIINTADGGFLITGATLDGWGQGWPFPFAIKLDATGAEEWRNIYKIRINSVVLKVKAAEQDDHYFLGTSNVWGEGLVLKINLQGDSIGSKVWPSYNGINDIVASLDGNLVVTGTDSIGQPAVTLQKFSPQFDSIWERSFVSQGPAAGGNSLIVTNDGGYALCGYLGEDGILLKTDSSGTTTYTLVKARVINDANGNCTVDVGEAALPGNMIQISSGQHNYYGLTDISGKTDIFLYHNGTSNVWWHSTTNHLWSSPLCQGNGFNLNIPLNDTIDLDVFATATIYCPELTVEVSTNMLRRCFWNNIWVNYCNNGTLPADSVYIDIDLSVGLILDTAYMPYTSLGGNVYRFPIDSLGIGQCGSFRMEVTVDCNSTVLGQTHCIEANIYPDTICLPASPSWDGSSMKINSQCQNDTIQFELKNQGTGDMNGPKYYIIVEDNVMYKQGQFQLQAGQSIIERIPGNGKTYTMIAPQSEGHPGNSNPLKSVEGCGTNGQGTFSTGFLTQYPQDDQDGFVDILCLQNIGSYDPNDKRPEPLGLDAEGYINATQPLDYTVRFQNTGTDTAFTVVIRDTLSPYLDITTLYLTGASHPYTFQIIGSNVLEWTFPNILLPDSNTNEPLSHGFVAFHISQADGNVPGTQITNRAGIYFDFNPPVITNTTLNTVVEDYKTLFTFVQSPESTLQLGIYPNPNTGSFSLDFATKTGATYEFAIYDLAGAKQFGQTLQGQAPYALSPELPSGMYLYQLLENGQPVGMGKVVVSK